MLTLPYTYADQDDMERIMSTAGVISRADHNRDGALNAFEQSVIAYVLSLATENCNMYLWNRYDSTQLQQSVKVQDWCAKLACYELSGERMNPAPTILTDWSEQAIDEMKEVAARRMSIPFLAERATAAPVWDNTRCDGRFVFKVIRVERGRSSKAPTTRPVVPDLFEQYTFEI